MELMNWVRQTTTWIGPGLFVYLTVSVAFIIFAIFALNLLQKQTKLLEAIKQEIKQNAKN